MIEMTDVAIPNKKLKQSKSSLFWLFNYEKEALLLYYYVTELHWMSASTGGLKP